MNPEQLARMRSEALRMNRNAGNKLRRLRQKGVSPSAIDPRVPAERIRRMNSVQLAGYMDRMDTFLDRRTQFVGSRLGQPISKQTWEEYKRVEHAVNLRKERLFNKYGDRTLPTGENVRTRREKFGGVFGGFVYDQTGSKILDRKPYNFTDERAVRRTIESERKKLTRGFQLNELRKWRNQAYELIAQSGNPELANRVRSLSPEKFEAMWRLTNFVHDASIRYEIEKSKVERRPYSTRAEEQTQSNVDNIVSWAENL